MSNCVSADLQVSVNPVHQVFFLNVPTFLLSELEGYFYEFLFIREKRKFTCGSLHSTITMTW